MKRAFKKETFCESSLSSKINEKIDEDLLIGGFKSVNDLKKTAQKLFFKVNGRDFLRITVAGEVNDIRFCVAVRMDQKMSQHPYNPQDYWLDLSFVWFDKRTRQMGEFPLEGNISLIPADEFSYENFVSEESLRKVLSMQQKWRGEKIMKEGFGVNNIKDLLK